MTRDEHTTNRPTPGGSAFQETGMMDDYLTRVAEAVRDAVLNETVDMASTRGFLIECIFDLPKIIASVPRPEPVAWVATYTEDGTSRVIFAGDSDLAGLHEHPDCWGLKPLYADAVAAQPAVPGGLLTAADMKHLRRFAECAEDMDAGGHDVPKEAMKRLERAGAVRSLGFGRHETTAFGDAMLAAAPEAPQVAVPDRRVSACLTAMNHISTETLESFNRVGIKFYATRGYAEELEAEIATLRSDIRAMASMLQAREWAEHVSTDPVVTDLEVQITELVGTATKLREQNAALLSELLTLCRGYVYLMEAGRDRIIALGGDCDPVDVMERNDPWLISARKVLASAKGGAA